MPPMHRFFLSPPSFLQDVAELSAEETHHCLNVLRCRPGDKITVFDGQGSEATAVLQDTEPAATVRIGPRAKTLELRCKITIAQAIPKGKNMELILQKAVELGAARIAPILSDRTVVQLESGDLEKKTAKWQSVVLEACKQCGQNTLPEVLPPASMKDFLSHSAHGELSLIASLQPDARHIKTVLADVEKELGRLPREVVILVGPEGDFTPAESATAKSAGFTPVTLGPVILRSETAAIYCMSVLAHELF